MWAPLVSCLPEYQCIILDRPGCGLSDPLGYKHLTKKRLTKLIVLIIDQVLRHFNLDMISVVASSFGGYLAMLYALEKPDKINKLVLEGPPAMVESHTIGRAWCGEREGQE